MRASDSAQLSKQVFESGDALAAISSAMNVRQVMSASEFLAAYRKAHCSEPRPLIADINQREIDALIARKTKFINGSTPLASGSCVESVRAGPEPEMAAR